MKYQIFTPARQELINSIEYYNKKEKNLGYKLLLDYEESVKRILNNPKAWQPLSTNTRRCTLTKFPYGIIYQIDNYIQIVAFMNLKRTPDYWKKIVIQEGFQL